MAMDTKATAESALKLRIGPNLSAVDWPGVRSPFPFGRTEGALRLLIVDVAKKSFEIEKR